MFSSLIFSLCHLSRCPSQMAKEHLGHLLEGQSNKRRSQSRNWSTQHGWYTPRKKTPLAWTCDTNGPPAHTLTGVALGGSGVQARSRSSTCKLEEHSQQGFVKDRNHLGGSRGDSSKQIRMASKCGPMHPFGCGLNQGQGSLVNRFICTTAGTAIARLSHRNSVCLSVHLSHGWIRQKRCKLGSSNLHHRLPQRL